MITSQLHSKISLDIGADYVIYLHIVTSVLSKAMQFKSPFEIKFTSKGCPLLAGGINIAAIIII